MASVEPRIVYEEALNSETLSSLRAAARDYKQRGANTLPDAFFSELEAIKIAAIDSQDEGLAAACWGLQTVGLIQNAFVAGFLNAQEGRFYKGWCDFANCETNMKFLNGYFPLDDDTFGLNHISEHLLRFQSLYPYRTFLSPGMTVKAAQCSICGEPIRLRQTCGHVKGRIYQGKMCGWKVTEISKILEISLVDAPVQKSAVIFGPDIPYNYGAIDYVVRGLRSPWHGWAYEQMDLDGGKAHIQVNFEYVPPPELPAYLADGNLIDYDCR
jgi:hypothetical protein